MRSHRLAGPEAEAAEEEAAEEEAEEEEARVLALPGDASAAVPCAEPLSEERWHALWWCSPSSSWLRRLSTLSSMANRSAWTLPTNHSRQGVGARQRQSLRASAILLFPALVGPCSQPPELVPKDIRSLVSQAGFPEPPPESLPAFPSTDAPFGVAFDAVVASQYFKVARCA
jgi:hypothetical protein